MADSTDDVPPEPGADSASVIDFESARTGRALSAKHPPPPPGGPAHGSVEAQIVTALVDQQRQLGDMNTEWQKQFGDNNLAFQRQLSDFRLENQREHAAMNARMDRIEVKHDGTSEKLERLLAWKEEIDAWRNQLKGAAIVVSAAIMIGAALLSVVLNRLMDGWFPR